MRIVALDPLISTIPPQTKPTLELIKSTDLSVAGVEIGSCVQDKPPLMVLNKEELPRAKATCGFRNSKL